MKIRTIHCASLIAGLTIATVSAAHSQTGEQRTAMRDVATHEELSNKLRQAQAANPLNNFKAVEGEAKTEVFKPVDLLESSDIISFNGLTTLVPKRAILAMPESVKNRVGKHVEGSRVVQFQEFLHANRGWVTAIEVTRKQAQGREKLPDSMTERIGKATNLIVATFNGGPISVLPPRTPEATENSSDNQEAFNP